MSTGVIAYTAFVIDAFAGTIVGWECSNSKVTVFVERAIRRAADKRRRREGNPLQGSTIHHSDATCDNALAETHDRAIQDRVRPGRVTVPDRAVRPPQRHRGRHQQIRWYNNDRLMHRLGRRPPVELEADYYAQIREGRPVAHT